MKSLFLYLFCALLSITCACQQSTQSNNFPFAKGENKGKVSKDLEEASGLVASINNSNCLWSMNDSGNSSDIFLINDKAELVMRCKLKNTKNRDWESITTWRNQPSKLNYVYVGETGDNNAKHQLKYLYRMEEPEYTGNEKFTIDQIETFIIRLPDGPRDMEALAADHPTGDLYLFSKREQNISVYYLSFDRLVAKDTLEPVKIGMLPFHNVVAADFSMDGKELLVKTYNEILYWRREDAESIKDVLMRKPVILDYHPEPQGESIAWALDGSGFYTLSESVDNERAKLYFYKRN